jgi:hypothetical protein
MQPEIYSQAERIARGDSDLQQNILAMTFQNTQNAISRGKDLSVGEQVNFMKYRAGNLKSGSRHDFGHGQYKGSQDVYARHLYFKDELEIYHIHYEDESEQNEQPQNGKGFITGVLAKVNLEDECLLAIDLENFIADLPVDDREILVRRMAGFSFKEIAEALKFSSFRVKDRFREICFHMLKHLGIRRAFC